MTSRTKALGSAREQSGTIPPHWVFFVLGADLGAFPKYRTTETHQAVGLQRKLRVSPGHHDSKPARHWSCGLFRICTNNSDNCCKHVADELFRHLDKPRKTWPATLLAGVGNCAKVSVE